MALLRQGWQSYEVSCCVLHARYNDAYHLCSKQAPDLQHLDAPPPSAVIGMDAISAPSAPVAPPIVVAPPPMPLVMSVPPPAAEQATVIFNPQNTHKLGTIGADQCLHNVDAMQVPCARTLRHAHARTCRRGGLWGVAGGEHGGGECGVAVLRARADVRAAVRQGAAAL